MIEPKLLHVLRLLLGWLLPTRTCLSAVALLASAEASRASRVDVETTDSMSELLELETIVGCSATFDISVIAAAAGTYLWFIGIFVGRCTGVVPLDEVPLMLSDCACELGADHPVGGTESISGF